MLATEETKTMYRDTVGKLHEERRDAEYESVKEAINCAATRVGNVDLGVLTQELNKSPEAKQWLLEQLGVQPLNLGHEQAIKRVWAAALRHAETCVGPDFIRKRSNYDIAQEALNKGGMEQFLRGIGRNLANATATTVASVDMSMAFGDATRVALRGNAVHALDQIAETAIKRVMEELQAQGYQLIKK